MPRVEWSFFLPAEDHHQFKRLLAFIQSRFTPWGQAIFSVGLFGLGISSVGIQSFAYFLPSFVLALFVTSWLLSLFARPRVEARRILSPTTAGGHFVYKVLVKNTGKRILRNLSLFEQCLPYGLYPDLDHPEFKNSVDWLEPGEQATCTLVFRTPRRGIFELSPLLACSDFPSGLFRSVRKTGAAAKFIVYPRIIVPEDIPVEKHRTYQRGGISESHKVGDSNEFASTRDYRHGDRLRDIHWTSTARTGDLIVKEYIEEYFVRIGFYIDTELKRFEKHLSFEARLSLCAGMCRELNERDYILDIFLSERKQHIQSGRGLNNLDRIFEFLSSIEGDRKVDFAQSLAHLKEYGRELSELIVFLKDWDRERAEFIRRLKETGLKVKTIIVRDKETTLAVDDMSVALYTPQAPPRRDKEPRHG